MSTRDAIAKVWALRGCPREDEILVVAGSYYMFGDIYQAARQVRIASMYKEGYYNVKATMSGNGLGVD
jgi:hypothetical protein